MPDTTPAAALPIVPVPDPAADPIGADITKMFNATVTAVGGALGGGAFSPLAWGHVLFDLLWLIGDLVRKYGTTPEGFQKLVSEFESFVKVNIIDAAFKPGGGGIAGGISAAVAWSEKHLVGPQILAVVRDQLLHHHAGIVATPAPVLPPVPVVPPAPAKV